MKLLPHCIQAISLDPLVALSARGGEELLVAILAVERPLLLYEAHINEGFATGAGRAVEVVRTPVLPECGHKRTPDLLLAASADGYSRSDGCVHDTSAPLGSSSLPWHSFRGNSSWT